MSFLIPKFDKSFKSPIYMQIYESIKSDIINGSIVEHSKLPSIRNLAKDLSLSTTTIENAYNQLLMEGYIESVSKSGYFVASIENLSYLSVKSTKIQPHPSILRPEIRNRIDPNAFNFNLWKKYLSQIINDEKNRLVSYPEEAGELELRTEISRFVNQSRGTISSPNQIVIGAGIQNLLGILIQILKDSIDEYVYEDPAFSKAKYVFEDYGIKAKPFSLNDLGSSNKDFFSDTSKLIYTNPSNQYPTGTILPINDRLNLIKLASETNSYILEDDYDSLLSYDYSPVPALQGIDNFYRTIYLGSFSKIFLPSIRLSFMILPISLLDKYNDIKTRYSQSVSVTEQLALAKMMNNGDFEKHIRKIRKIYKDKNDIMKKVIKQLNPEKANFLGLNSGLYVLIEVFKDEDFKSILNESTSHSIKVEILKSDKKVLILHYAGIETSRFEEITHDIFKSLY